MKTILEHAIVIEGSKSALARAIGVSPVSITHWGKRGLPRAREIQLIKLYGRRKPKKWAAPKE